MNHPGLKWGLYYAGIAVLYTTVLKFVSPKLLFNVPLGLLVSLVLPIVCMVISGKELRTLQDGYLSFGEALKNSILVLAVGSLISIFYEYILFNFIDTSLLELQQEAIIGMGDWMTDLMEDSGVPEEQLDEQREALREQAEAASHQTLGQMIMGWMGGVLFGFIPAAIVSAIIKKTD